MKFTKKYLLITIIFLGIKSLIAMNGSDINALNKNGLSRLHLAVMNRNADEVSRLLAQEANVDIKSTDHKKTPLHFAVERGCVQIMVMLLKAGHPVDVKTTDGLTPLDYAQTKCPPELRKICTELILEALAKTDNPSRFLVAVDMSNYNKSRYDIQ